MTGRPMRSARLPQNLAGARSLPWYRIENKVDDGPTRVHIYDEIGWFGVTPTDFVNSISAVEGDLDVHINSPGGDVFDGIAIYNSLKQRAGSVAVTVDGLAASAASFIAQAASPGRLLMAPHAEMMIHEGFGMAIGNAQDMIDMAAQLDRVSGNIAGIYADRTGKSAEYWRELMKAETWMSDEQAVAYGLADGIVGREPPTVGAWNLGVFGGYGTRNEKYTQADRDKQAGNGHAMPDGSYPIEDGEDLHNAIHAVGRGGDEHNAIRRHIIERAKALGMSEEIPANWRSDGSRDDSAGDHDCKPGACPDPDHDGDGPHNVITPVKFDHAAMTALLGTGRV
jgi:ATP-dependent Clp endopeptidase proteolytic subunit ClpP